MQLDGKVCVVTGGAQGVGWALAQAFAARGARVYACDISHEHLAKAQEALKQIPRGELIQLTHADVADPASVNGWLGEVYARESRVDVLINNAAFVRWKNVLDMSLDEELQTMRVGYDAMVFTTRYVLPRMLQSGGGHIVNMGSSVSKLLVGGSSAAYAAVKAAIDAYTQMLQVELRKTPIHLTVVRPAAIAGTDFFKRNVPSERLPRMGDFVPYLTPPEVAESILRAIQRKRDTLDVPGFLPFFYLFFSLLPEVFRWLITVGGSGRRDYGNVAWHGSHHGEEVKR